MGMKARLSVLNRLDFSGTGGNNLPEMALRPDRLVACPTITGGRRVAPRTGDFANVARKSSAHATAFDSTCP